MKRIFDLQKLITFRRLLHKYPEGSLQEFDTTNRILDFLLTLGVKREAIQVVINDKTGLIVDIPGRKKVDEPGQKKTVLFRADIDGLPMKEVNPMIDYQSVTDHAHMCGHDGHITCLLGGISLLMEHLDEMPETSVARFIFQPAEEKYGGAKMLVDAGCLNGVSEAWGFHNVPHDPIGKILVKSGPVTSDVTAMRITVTGKGGHSSIKADLKDPLFPASEMIVAFEAVLANEFGNHVNKDIVFIIPAVYGQFAFNVIADSVKLEGTLRAFDLKVKDKFIARLKQVMSEIAAKHQVEATWEVVTSYSMIQNDVKLTEDLKNLLGNTSEERLPFKFSEDFSEYSNLVPGCFYFVCIGSQAGKGLHVNNYNFNDDVIEFASETWLKIIKDRLGF